MTDRVTISGGRFVDAGDRYGIRVGPEKVEATHTPHRLCSWCGELREVEWTVDPYEAEVNPGEPNPPAWWCQPCLDERHDDV